MSENIPWVRVKKLGLERIDAIRSALETAPPDKITALQAEARAWRQVLELPATLAAERDNQPTEASDY